MKKIFIFLLLIISFIGFKVVQAEELDFINLNVEAFDINENLIPDSKGTIIQKNIDDDNLELSWYRYTYVDTGGFEYVLNDPYSTLEDELFDYFWNNGAFVSKDIYVINGYFAIKNNNSNVYGLYDGVYQILPDMILYNDNTEVIIDDIEYTLFVNVNDNSDLCFRKTITENDETFYVGLDNEKEFEKVLLTFTKKTIKEVENA